MHPRNFPFVVSTSQYLGSWSRRGAVRCVPCDDSFLFIHKNLAALSPPQGRRWLKSLYKASKVRQKVHDVAPHTAAEKGTTSSVKPDLREKWAKGEERSGALDQCNRMFIAGSSNWSPR